VALDAEAPVIARSASPVVVIGGAGFIGCNLVAHLVRAGHRVRIFDDLSRRGVHRNLAWLQRAHGDGIESRIADIRDRAALRQALSGVSAVFHLAAQVAVTTSLADPRSDFDVNTRGTLEVLEALRTLEMRPPVVFASTSKVYGSLHDLRLRLDGERWVPEDPVLADCGIDERRPLEFRTPHACSKGAADQYVLDYAHSFGVPATVLRVSCVYGPHQLGTEDQGWVAQFLIRALENKPITIYGDGQQVRDVLFVDDAVDAFVRAWTRIGMLSGHAFNIGGGPANAISLAQMLALIERCHGKRPVVQYADWREGDQRYYASNTHAFTTATGWTPRVSASTGIEALYGWLSDQREGVARHA
jgi:CDP-paratose 2-epimerase